MPGNHRVSLTSPLGDTIFPCRVSVQEELGRPFEVDLELLSTDPDVDFDAILGQKVTVAIEMGDGKERHWNGYVCELSQGLAIGEYASFRAAVRPWLWMLTRTSDCRIFQGKSAPDIVKEVFRDQGFSDFKDKLSGTYEKREYCVQYRETAFDFVSRLLEEEGIYYFFTHEEGAHTLVLADGASSHATVSGYEKIPFFPPGGAGAREREHVFGWTLVRNVQPGAVALDGYDFERPKASLEAKSVTPWKHAQSKFEMYDFPGRYTQSSTGDHYAKIRMEELAARHERVSVEGTVRGVGAGDLFSLEDFPRADQNREYLIVSASVQMESDEKQVGSGTTSPFRCQLEVISSKEKPFRPARATPRPIVEGPHTATVVGKAGEEIWTDKYGRVKVQFPWDRYGKSNEESSCWVRVGSPWAGKSFGGVQIPRIGEEVIVDFLGGDPDCPIITGRMYNGDNMPPYALPAKQTQSGFKTRSSKSGSTESFNELRFEDEKGKEEVYLHAEKNFTRVVENDDSLKVGFEKKGSGSQTVEIWKDRTTKLQTGNDSLKIELGNQTTDLAAGKATTSAMQSIELKVGGNSIKIDQSGITLKGIMIKIEGQAMVDVKGAMTTVQGQGMLTLKGGLLLLN